ncbi:MAG: aldolase [Candidatus Abyssobacteria bacterium SURF_17]|uniref:Aldolase n=1 Tax=Candidatus Abyssobacteria bacterium SURF_17 TaxID=2093361 RepID=A0A419EQI9_9BACT|nr:MAG: aldolase [Candidatus Abyssubacteria bacterium SURF_17]
MTSTTLYKNPDALKAALKNVVSLSKEKLDVSNEQNFRKLAYALVYNSIFNSDKDIQELCRWLVRAGADACGIHLASIHDLYMARGRGECSGFTVPAINIRGLTYDVAHTIFKSAMKGKVGPVLFEIARSEIGYTLQRPAEYTTAVVGAALASGYKGPVCMQGDHFQVNAKKYKASSDTELGAIHSLIEEAITGGFFNIDIDASTLVDLTKPNEEAQQEINAALTHEYTMFIRDKEPNSITISIGGEIGEVGTKNSTVEDLQGYMSNYKKKLEKSGKNVPGISKISVQTGTTHGGVPLPDGTIAKVKVDFDTLEKLSKVSREKYGMAGAVQHGASTLPEDAFHIFADRETAEVHLATEFQNMIYDNAAFPADLRQEIYAYLDKECADEKKEGQTQEQFIYKTRKKAFGPFKKQVWDLPADVKTQICSRLETKFDFLFKQLAVLNTDSLTKKFIKPVSVTVAAPNTAGKVLGQAKK